MPLPTLAIAASLVANWIASENLTGLTGEVACKHVFPAILLDPICAALCLALLGVLLAPFTGRYSSLSDIVVKRYGGLAGGLASCLCLAGSLLWAAAQYKAVLQIVNGAAILPQPAVEPAVIVGLLVWTLLGGIVADVWLDALSVFVVAPVLLAVAAIALSKIQPQAFAAEAKHAAAVLPSQSSMNMLSVGMLGNLFTEELAGRVLLAKSPGHARAACLMAMAIFLVIGMAPAILGFWASSVPQVVLDGNGESLCKDDQDSILSAALSHLLPTRLSGSSHLLEGVLILESLNTVDTSILMIANVVASHIKRASCSMRILQQPTKPAACATLALIVMVSRLGDNVWELSEAATASVGAPLAVLCLFAPTKLGGQLAAVTGAGAAQLVYSALKWRAAPGQDDHAGMPFVWATLAGAAAYLSTAMRAKSKEA